MHTLFRPGLRYLTEGGQETELMYGYGFDLPQFALFPLLDDPAAVTRLTSMYQAVLEVAVRHEMGVVLGGLDYRASPDWAGLLGLDAAALAKYQRRSVDFLRQVSAPYRDRLPHILIVGTVGPQGDAYERNERVTADSAETYHAVQVATLAAAGVDVVLAMTFTSADEAIGVVRAARAQRLPVIVSFMPGGPDEPGLGSMIRRVDDATDGYPVCYGLNCSHPLEFGPQLEHGGEWTRRIGVLRPNASSKDKVELCQIGHLERGDPVDLARRMGELAQRMPHVSAWGGCCGTWDEHLELIAAAVHAAPSPANPAPAAALPGPSPVARGAIRNAAAAR